MHNKYYTLITGASEGLGKCMAMECAAKKMNLILVALPQTGLKNLALYITETYAVDVIIIEKDLSDDESCKQMYEEVKQLNISVNILINNAGMGGTFLFNEKDSAYYTKLIKLNVVAPTVICRLFINDLKKHEPAYILNVSSLGGFFYLPKKQVYGGTKAYLLAFSKSLRRELKSENVSVSVLCPGGMNTNWQLLLQNRISGTWLSRQSIMEPSEVAFFAIQKMLQKKEVIVPGRLNQLFLFWNRLLPVRIKDFLIALQMKKVQPSFGAVVIK